MDEAVLSTNPTIFLVTLGGQYKGSNVEVHDVRVVAGFTIKDTIPILRSQWFGNSKGLHVDSYLEVKYVNGFSIHLSKSPHAYGNKSNTNHLNEMSLDCLWFVNLGYYKASDLCEHHRYGLVAAVNSSRAIQIAKDQWNLGSLSLHVDDVLKITSVLSCGNGLFDNYQQKWYIKLVPDCLNRTTIFDPHWQGYWRIDENHVI